MKQAMHKIIFDINLLDIATICHTDVQCYNPSKSAKICRTAKFNCIDTTLKFQKSELSNINSHSYATLRMPIYDLLTSENLISNTKTNA